MDTLALTMYFPRYPVAPKISILVSAAAMAFVALPSLLQVKLFWGLNYGMEAYIDGEE